MPQDITKIIYKMIKICDYYGKGKEVSEKMKMVYNASNVAMDNPESIRQIFGAGYKDKEIKKLIATLDKRAKIADEASKAKFPELKSTTTEMWGKWFFNVGKFGENARNL